MSLKKKIRLIGALAATVLGTAAALAQVRSGDRAVDREGEAFWAEQSRPILDAVSVVETVRACRLTDEATASGANRHLGGIASDLYWRQLGQPVSPHRWTADFNAAERQGFRAATAEACRAMRSDPARVSVLKAWVGLLASGKQ